MAPLTLVAVGGIIVGVIALVVVSSVMNGFERAVQQSVTSLQGDVLVYTRGQPFENTEQLIEKIRTFVPELVAWTPSFAAELMLSGADGSAGSLLEGLDPQSIAHATSLADHLIDGRLPSGPGEIVLAEGLAERLGIGVSGSVRLIFPSLSGGPRVEVATCVGRIRLGMYQYDSKYAFATIEQVRAWSEVRNLRWTSIRLKLSDGTVARVVAERLQSQFPYPIRVKDWTLLNRNLSYAIALEKAMLLVLMGLVVIVASFNIVSALMILLFEKKIQFSVLRILGATRADLVRMVTLIGILLGVTGAALGILIGIASNYLLERSQLFELSQEIYQIGHFSFEARFGELLVVFGGVVLLATLAAWFPASTLKRKSLIEGLRGD